MSKDTKKKLPKLSLKQTPEERKQQELQYLQLQNRGRKYIGQHWD